MGSYEQALSMYRSIKVKKVRQNIVRYFFNMGCVLYKQNKIAEALASFKEGLLIEEAIATPSDKDAAMERLAFLGEFFPINSFQNLTPLLHQQQGLVLQNFLLNKKTHLNIANFLRDVGSRFYELNSYDLALISFEQALKMYRALSNQSNHINVACTLRAMGIVYRLIDQHEKALEHFRQALAIFYLLYGKDPKSRTFGIITHISATLISLKQYSEAVELRKQALAMCQVLYGSGPNEKIASELQDLGQTISWVNRTEAIRMIEQSLEMYIQVYQNKPHLKIAETLYLLGKYYAVSEDSARAIVFWRQALAMARDPAVYGNNPSELVDWIDKVAFSIMGEGSSSNEKCYKEARSLYFEEYNILSELHKGPHSNRARILRNIGVCYSKLDGNRAGVLWFKQSLDMYRSLYGKDDAHPDIVEILANIQSLGGSDSCVIS
ncbi:MAG: tetratricopeptide repeat protein [Rhabdochlamydiaceae bacterium]|jgi:tetratricopeptide (TPR) repeat protein